MYIPRIRRITDAIATIQQQDPDTALTWHVIQHLIQSGKLTARKFGNAWLINLDELYRLFKKGGQK